MQYYFPTSVIKFVCQSVQTKAPILPLLKCMPPKVYLVRETEHCGSSRLTSPDCPVNQPLCTAGSRIVSLNGGPN